MPAPAPPTPIALAHATVAPGARLAAVAEGLQRVGLRPRRFWSCRRRPSTDPMGQLVTPGAGDLIEVTAAESQESRSPSLVLHPRWSADPRAGQAYGPFVMNTRAGFVKAFEDSQAGRPGVMPENPHNLPAPRQPTGPPGPLTERPWPDLKRSGPGRLMPIMDPCGLDLTSLTRKARSRLLVARSPRHAPTTNSSAPLATVVDGDPWAVPLLFARDDDRLLLHGSTGAGALRHVTAGAPIAFSVTAIDGVVVAESTFESSVTTRFRRAARDVRNLRDDERAPCARSALGAHPSRTDDRGAPSTPRVGRHAGHGVADHRRVLALQGSGPGPGSAAEEHQAWCGVVPMTRTFGEPEPAP